MEAGECSGAITQDMREMDALLRMADFAAESRFLETMLKQLSVSDELQDDELDDVVAAACLPQKSDKIYR